jgi:predicted ribosomally synthesized peptide with SipW-like signal peptide
MLKIIGLLTALVIIIATLSVGTFAYFNDVTTVTGNTISAGTLTLQVDDGTPVAISLSNMVPTNGGTAATWAIEAGGSVNGTLGINVGAITNNENTRANIETASGDTTSGATEGELGGKLKIALWIDADADHRIDNGEKYLNSDGSVGTWAGGDDTDVTASGAPSSIFFTVDSFGGDNFANVKTNFTGAGGTFYVEYYFPNDLTQTTPPYYDDNQAQSDGLEFNLTFILTQT